jgi:DNA-directed RNA polymerase subunit RPC12/RpoP
MAKPLYKIREWAKTFEVAQSRKQPTEMSWVPIPTRLDGKRYRKLVKMPDADRVLGCFMVMVEIAANRPIDRRGYLEDSDGPFDAEDLHIISGLPKESFEFAIKCLTSKGIEWLIDATLVEQPAKAGCSGLQDKTRQDRTRHHNGAFEVDCERFKSEYPKTVSDWDIQILLSEVRTQADQDRMFDNLGLYRTTDEWKRNIIPSAENWLKKGFWKVEPKGAKASMHRPQRVYQCGECGDTGLVVLMDKNDELTEQPCPKCGGKAAA